MRTNPENQFPYNHAKVFGLKLAASMVDLNDLVRQPVKQAAGAYQSPCVFSEAADSY